MRNGRTVAGTIGVALAMLALVPAAAPAQADRADRADSTPVAAQASVLTPSPGISPAADRVTHVGRHDFADYYCRLGRACLAVWDVNFGDWKVFDLFRCGAYSLSYWYDGGAMKNNQTGNAAVRTYGSGGGLIKSYPPKGNELYEVDWFPVWTVRPC